MKSLFSLQIRAQVMSAVLMFLILLLAAPAASAQGVQTSIWPSGSSATFINLDGTTGSSTYYDVWVDDPEITELTFTLKGGDGGSAKLVKSGNDCFNNGGQGATVTATFRVTLPGSDASSIAVGGWLRFIVGGKGENGQSNAVLGAGYDYGGGGGGTAVLYRASSSSTWELLAVAGGGGGAYIGAASWVCSDGNEDGQGGRDTESGGNGGGGTCLGTGGTGGQGGNLPSGVGCGPYIGAGGGAYSSGENDGGCSGEIGSGSGLLGGTTGSIGGFSCRVANDRYGGFGFGSGGAGWNTGGGGGGYSGGGAGGSTGRGGGGGSYVNSWATTSTITAGGNTSNPTNGLISYTTVLNLAPIANCKNTHVAFAVSTCEQQPIPSMFDNGSYDPEGGSLYYSVSPSAPLGIGTHEVTLTVSDGHLSASCRSYLTVVDGGWPVFTDRPADTTVTCVSEIPAMEDLAYTDNCSAGGTVAGTQSGDCSSGVITRTWTVSDDAGITTTHTQTITINDEPPVAQCKDITVTTFLPNGTTTAYAGGISFGSPTMNDGSYDECGTVSITWQETGTRTKTLYCSDIGTTRPHTINVTDACGHVSTCTANITLIDVGPPVVVCTDLTVQLNAVGTASIGAEDIGVYGDNCSIETVSLSGQTAYTCEDIDQVYPVTLTVTDVGGTSRSCTANVTVSMGADTYCNQPPISLCEDVIVSAGADCLGTGTTDIGSWDPDGDEIVLTMDPPGPYPLGTTIVNLIATDPSGATDFCTSTITVVDDTPPTALCRDMTVQLESDGGVYVTATQVDNGSSDNCSIASILLEGGEVGIAFYCDDIGEHLVSLQVSDDAGNMAVCNTIITVEDNIAPTITCPSNMIVGNDPGQCGAIVDYTVVAGDNCSATVSANWNSGSFFSVGTTTVTATAADDAGNSVACTFNVTVNDAEAPVALCQDLTVQFGPDGSVYVPATQLDNGSSDNCGIASTLLEVWGEGVTLYCGGVQSYAVSLEVSDDTGNMAVCNAIITVEDNIAPTITCPSNMIVGNDPGQCGAIVAYTVAVEDNCGAGVTADWSSGSFFSVGTTTVTATAADNAGNSAACTFNVTVNDSEPPVALCKDITVQFGPDGSVYVPATQLDNGSSDNCGMASILLEVWGEGISLYCGPVESYPISLQVSDDAGNMAVCNAIITVEDNIAPTITCPSNMIVGNDPGQCGAIVAYTVAVEDNCGAAVSADWSSGSFFSVGTTTVTATAADNAGNSAACTFNVTVNDTEPPVALCKDITVQFGPDGSVYVSATQLDNGSSDNCGIASILQEGWSEGTTLYCSGVQSYAFSLHVSDYAGNSAVCNSIVTVEDNITPTITCPSNMIVGNDPGQCGAIVAYTVAVEDNCGAAVSANWNSGSFFSLGTTAVTVTATDDGGNSAACTFYVAVSDIEPPISVCTDITVELGENGTYRLGTDDCMSILSNSIDNCGIATNCSAIGDFLLDCSDVGSTISMPWFATDAYGNYGEPCWANITVTDPNHYCNQPPVAVCQDVTVSTKFNCLAFGSIDNGTFDPDGDEITITLSPAGPYPLGATNVTLTVTDPSGESDACTATITVVDDIAPTAVCLDIAVQLDSDGSAVVTSGDIDGGSTDNCGISSIFIPKAGINGLSVDCSNVGVNNIALQVEDIAGNSSTCISVVTVEDNEAPVAICQDVTVQLDATGNGSTSASAIDNGSNDACGIAGLSATPINFDCSHLGANTVTLTVTDNNGNSSTCTATVEVIGVVPVVSISESLQPALCQGGTIVLTAHSDVEVQAYLWSTGETSSSIQVNEDGIYSVEVTSLTGCVSSASYEVSGYDAGSLLSSYTILSTKGDVHLHGDNVVTSGGVGVMGSDRKAKLHDNVVVHTFVQAVEVDLNNNSSAAEIIWQPANPPLPPFINNPYAAENNVTVDEDDVVVLSECIYDKVDIKKDATVTFTCENIFIHELKTQDGVTIQFSGSSNLFINKKVKLKKENSFNPQAATVTVYVDESFEVDEGSDVTAQVYATKDIKAEGKSDKPTTMTGIFIGDKVEGKDFVTWNWDINCDPAPAPELPEPCDACKGGITQMDLIYNGTDTAQVTVTGENGVPVYFSGVIAPGETITVFGVIIGEKLDKEAEIYVEGVLHAQVHTSGSQPIGPGLVLGDFTMVYAECKDNDDPICPIGQNLARVSMSSELTEQKMLQALENEAYPNPFNAEATIRFTVPESAVTVVEVISVNGEMVQSFEMGMLEADRPHEIKLNAGDDWVSGVYHYRIISGKYTANGNMVYLK